MVVFGEKKKTEAKIASVFKLKQIKYAEIILVVVVHPQPFEMAASG